MNLSSFSPEQAVVSPEKSEREQEKREALNMIVGMLQDKHKEISAMKTTLELAGKERALRAGSAADMVAFRAQTLHHASEEVLKEVRGVDYKKEVAAAKLEEFLHSYELFAMRYAELLETDPDLAKRLGGIDPSLEVVGKTGIAANDNSFENKSVHGDNSDAKYSVG